MAPAQNGQLLNRYLDTPMIPSVLSFAPGTRDFFRRVLRARIQSELLAIFILCAATGLGLLFFFDSEFGHLSQLTEQVNAAGRLRMLSQRSALLTRAATHGEINAISALETAKLEFDAGLRSLRQYRGPHATELDGRALEKVAASWAELKFFSNQLLARRPVKALTDAESAILTELAENTLAAAEANVQAVLPRAEEARGELRKMLLLSVVLMVLQIMLMLGYVRRRILRPLHLIEGMLDRISAGDLGVRLAVQRRDEIGRMMHRANVGAEALEILRAKETAILEELRDSETRHRTLWEISTEAIVIIDRDSIIRFANPAVERTFGWRTDELIGKNIELLQPEHLRAAHRAGMARYLSGDERKLNWASVEIQALHRDGHEIQVDLAFSEMHLSQKSWFVGTFRDITERKRHEEELLHSAKYDSLTGLPNRVLLFDRMDQALHISRRHNSTFGVLYIDLDNFKVINDSLGHDSGDELLREAGRRLLTCVRDGDSVARVGGDEFVLLLTDLQRVDDIDLVAQRALTAMSQVFNVGASEGFVGASIGAALYPHDGRTRSELLQHADIAMYRAKEYGRNNYQRYAEHMQARYKLRMSMESLLRKAIEANELSLHYQPQIELGSGRIIGAEALLRWENPTLGRVSPVQFIPLAEETGLIVTIGNWVIDRACCDAASWIHTAEGNQCRVAINLSARQFSDESLLDSISSAISRYELSPEKVELEITESLVMQSPEQASAVLNDLRKLGCQVALDDFGTGYSSLAYLRHFPLDCLKIDKSLIQDVGIVRAVIQLAQSFGLKTLAEGVENEPVLALLRHLGCDIIQGYYYSKPLPLAEFKRFLVSHAEQLATQSAKDE
jgi:diguanylate cyclase (GGDEF)-like protein/PAS domain S-box-containing protein